MIINTFDGGSVIVGGAMSNNQDVSGNHGLVDYWVVKLDETGKIEWQKALGGSGFDIASGVQQTTDSGYVVAGISSSANGDVTGPLGGQDCWVVKLDSKGNIIWQKSFGGPGYETGYSIAQTNDNGFVIAGTSGSIGGDVSNNNGIVDVWVLKVDGNGVLQWEKSFGGSKIDGTDRIRQTSDGGYIVVGYTGSNDKDVSGNHGKDDFLVLRLNSSGNIIWQKCFGGSEGDYAKDVVQAPDGGFVIVGLTTSTDGDVTGNHGSTDYLVVKVDANGNLQWQKCYGGSLEDAATSIRLTSNNTYIIGGLSSSKNGDVTGNHGMADIWLIETALDGSVIWQKCYGGSRMDYEATIIQAKDGGLLIGGATTSNDGDVSGNHSSSHDLWVAKLIPPPCIPAVSITASSTNICYNPSIVFTAVIANGGASPVYRWKKNGIIAGTNSQTFTASALSNGDVIVCELTSSAACATTQPVAVSNSITMTATETTPEVTIEASANNICTGNTVTFTANNKSGNPNPVYQWTVDGVTAGDNTPFFITSTLKNGNVVQCIMTVAHCTVGTTKGLSNPITIIVSPVLQPSITIATANTTVCKGGNTTFTASAQQAGANPIYKWMVNGNSAGSNNSTFTSNAIMDGDVISCTVVVDPFAKCVVVNNAVSNSISMRVIEGVLPSVTIVAPTQPVCEGTTLNLSAIAVNAGNTPAFQWQLNGNNVGNNSINYSSNNFVNDDKVNCVLTPNNSTCGNTAVTSNIVLVAIKPLPVINLTPADTVVSAGSEVKITAKVYGDVSSFIWTPPGQLANTNTLTTVTRPLYQTTIFKIEVTSTGSCVATKESKISVFSEVRIPTSFTPNGDGKNDLFRVPVSAGFVLDELIIYGRWGNIIFRTKDINRGWDGTYSGVQMETGTYIYVITGAKPGQRVSLKGTVILLR